jgi:AAA15 family ATPase/GTPase
MKLDKLKVNDTDNKTIGNGGLEIEIKPYTVLVGENNSGKTNIVTAFKNQESKKINIIYFPASNVELEKSDEASVSKKSSPLYKLLSEILKKEKFDIDEEIAKPINSKLSEITKKINENFSFVNKKETILKVIDVLSEEAVIKNLIPLKLIDKYWNEGKIVDPGDVGQGTQRMVIFALLKYYAEQEDANEKLNFFIIEEPEVYLHPKLKQEFNRVLSEIAKKENNQVLITTHDPYFVEMNVEEEENKIIIEIRRNRETGFTEKVDLKPKFLPVVSHGEINYRVFNIYSDSFHNELYGYLEASNKSKLEGFPKGKYWIDSRSNQGDNVSLQTYIRHSIHHPENTLNVKFTKQELEQSIEEIVTAINPN